MDIQQSLEKLDPRVRERVEASLKATLEQELSKTGGIGDNPAAVFSRSKGWVFSRSKTSDILRDPPELLRSITTMDEAAFRSFAKRLSTLKQMKDATTVDVKGIGNG
jgi:hypothetical protein